MGKEVDNFYYSLKSKDDKKIHSENNTENFRVTLKDPIQLEGEWEVGLSSLFIPHIVKYEFNSIFKVLVHLPEMPSRNPDNDKYWIEITLNSDKTWFSDVMLDFWTEIRIGIQNYFKLTTAQTAKRLGKYYTTWRGAYNWYPAHRIKWGTIIAISTDLASFFNINWQNEMFLKKDFSETSYGLRTINQRTTLNKLQLKGQTWVTLNPSKGASQIQDNLIQRRNNENINNEIKILVEKDKKDEEISKIHSDVMYHNTILVKTNLINQKNITKPEYKNLLRVVTLSQEKEGENQHQYDFSPIFYYPLRVSILNTVKIKLKRFKFSDIIDHITFEGDTAIVILHFRKRHSIL